MEADESSRVQNIQQGFSSPGYPGVYPPLGFTPCRYVHGFQFGFSLEKPAGRVKARVESPCAHRYPSAASLRSSPGGEARMASVAHLVSPEHGRNEREPKPGQLHEPLSSHRAATPKVWTQLYELPGGSQGGKLREMSAVVTHSSPLRGSDRAQNRPDRLQPGLSPNSASSRSAD